MTESLELYDDFTDNRGEGSVVGTLSTSGHKRWGVDIEKVISIDNESLRIAPLLEAGFGRTAIAYGPFQRRNGLAFAVNILNGHNTAQAESFPDTFQERLGLWLRGNEIDPRWQRIVRWLGSGRVRRTLRQFRRWKRCAKDSRPVSKLDENLAVGWYPAEVVPDPRLEGGGFIMHALGPENGELWVGGNGTRTRAVRGVQNLPLYFVAVLREEGVIYYVSSLDGAPGMGTHPKYRPVGIEKGPSPEKVYLGVQQGVLGQIGWRLDTRLKGIRIAQMEGYQSWFGGAHGADRLTGEGNLDKSRAEAGGEWRVSGGGAERGVGGATGSMTDTLATVDPGLTSGLIHAEVLPGQGKKRRLGLIWRFRDEKNHWRMEITERVCEVALISEGKRQILASKEFADPLGGRIHRLQVLDTGNETMAYVDGQPVAESWVRDARLEGAAGVGIFLGKSDRDNEGFIRSFEAHPRQVAMPDSLSMGSPWVQKGSRIVIADDFNGPAGDLEGRQISVGSKRWTRVIGSGVMETNGNGAARIRGSVAEPCPGRTAYCLDWENPGFADLEVTVTPPGTKRGENERSIAGFILYEDMDNYVTLNVWRTDYYGGSSISTFFKYKGFEDLYDAIWTNVGDRVYYGRPSRLRLCCDGGQYLVFVNGEPVLYRAFRDVYPDFARLRINKIGLLANWEFGKDTGSKFERFQARI